MSAVRLSPDAFLRISQGLLHLEDVILCLYHTVCLEYIFAQGATHLMQLEERGTPVAAQHIETL